MFRERSREYQEHFGDISKGMKGHIAIFSMGFQESFSRFGGFRSVSFSVGREMPGHFEGS